jgi:hypothetical protein
MSDGVKGMLAAIDKKLDLLVQSHETIAKTCTKHDVILYGNPDDGKSIGLIRKVDGIGGRLDNIQRFAVIIWTAIFTIIQAAVAVVLKHRS